MKHILYTAFDRSVVIVTPDPSIYTRMHEGDPFYQNMPRSFADDQIERNVKLVGVDRWTAQRYVLSLLNGGRTSSEVLELIRDRDCKPHGTGFELLDTSELYRDRWFRDAWRRSPNGGPIEIDINLARRIQWSKLKGCLNWYNKKRDDSFDEMPFVELDFEAIRKRIREIDCPRELKAYWPANLPMPSHWVY